MWTKISREQGAGRIHETDHEREFANAIETGSGTGTETVEGTAGTVKQIVIVLGIESVNMGRVGIVTRKKRVIEVGETGLKEDVVATLVVAEAEAGKFHEDIPHKTTAIEHWQRESDSDRKLQGIS